MTTKDGDLKFKEIQIMTNLDCNLRCKYCYESLCDRVNKWDDVERFLKYQIEHYPKDNNGVFVDLIGGETLLHIDLVEKISELSVKMCEERGYNLTVSISTNGTLITKSKRIQDYIQKYKKYLKIGVSIDGTKENHNAQRVSPTGQGSYDDALAGFKYLKGVLCGCKVSIKYTYTIDGLDKLADGIISLIEAGAELIYANPVFEGVYTLKEDGIHFLEQHLKICDYLKENNLTHINLPNIVNYEIPAPFNDLKPEYVRNTCGAVKHMTCLGMDKEIYGCNRFGTSQDKRNIIGYLQDDGSIKYNNNPLAEKVKYIADNRHEDCKTCPVNGMCNICGASANEQGVEQYLSNKPGCGYTWAKAVSNIYLTAQRGNK